MDFKRKTSSAGGISFAWTMAAALPESKSHKDASSGDIHAKEFERWLKPYSTANKFEYIPDKAVTAHTIQFFHQTLAQCLYETTTRRPFTEASHEVLEAIMAGESVESLLKMGNVPCYLKPEKVHQEDLSKYIVKEFNDVPFYVYETETGIFQPQSLQTLVRFLKGDSSYSFSLWIQDLSRSEEGRKLLYHQPISPTATQHVERSSLSFVWCCLDNEGAYWTFSVRFPEEKLLFAFANQYAIRNL